MLLASLQPQLGRASQMATITVAEALRDSLVQLRIMHIDSDQVSAPPAQRSHHTLKYIVCTLLCHSVHTYTALLMFESTAHDGKLFRF
jgi:hypothetical protein